MDNQTRNELKRQKHADDQAHIIRLRNAEIQALKAEKGRLQRALQERPDTPSEALIERVEAAERVMHKTVRERDEALRTARRPLTADDITDEMRIRAWRAMREWENREWSLTHEQAGDMVLRAALTEPTRPVTLESIVDEALTKYTGGYLNGDEVGPYVASKYADLADRSN